MRRKSGHQAIRKLLESKSESKPISDLKALRLRHKPYDKKVARQTELHRPKKTEEKKSAAPRTDVSQSDKEKKAKLIQRKWRKVLKDEKKLVPVVVGKKHQEDNPEFLFYLHGQKVKKTLNLDLQKKLKKALDEGDWQTIRGMGKLACYAAMSLSQKKQKKSKQPPKNYMSITPDQRDSVMDFISRTDDLKLMDVHPILDDKQEFTEAAKTWLLPILAKLNQIKILTPEAIEKFRLLVAELPKSEQFFYRTETGRYKTHPKPKPSPGKSTKYAGDRLKEFDTMLSDADSLAKSNFLLFFTTGTRHALGIAKHGIERYVAARSRLGTFTPEDIVEGVESGFRMRAAPNPDIKTPPEVHDYVDLLSAEMSLHDDYHADVWSLTPIPARKGLLHMAQVARRTFKDFLDTKKPEKKEDKKTEAKEIKKFKSLFSKEIWEYPDGEFFYFSEFHQYWKGGLEQLKYDEKNLLEMTKQFSELLVRGPGEFSGNSYLLSAQLDYAASTASRRIFDYVQPTPFGIATFMDMVKNRGKWLEMGLNPDFLDAPFKEFFAAMKDHVRLGAPGAREMLQPEPKNIFCWHIFFELRYRNKLNEFPKFIEWFSKQSFKIEFRKKTADDDLWGRRSANIICLSLNHDKMNYFGDDVITFILKKFKAENKESSLDFLEKEEAFYKIFPKEMLFGTKTPRP